MEDSTQRADCDCTLAQRLYVALVEQRVVDSHKYGEPPYAPITPEDVWRELARVKHAEVGRG